VPIFSVPFLPPRLEDTEKLLDTSRHFRARKNCEEPYGYVVPTKAVGRCALVARLTVLRKELHRARVLDLAVGAFEIRIKDHGHVAYEDCSRRSHLDAVRCPVEDSVVLKFF